METRRLGRTDIYVPPVIFGAWAIGGWYWGGTDDEQAIAAIRTAVDLGITAIDTAPVYGRGHSERIVGRAIRGMRDQVVIMTKVGLRWDDRRGPFFFEATDPDGSRWPVHRNLRPDSIRHEVERSLDRLGVDVIDVLQVHWPDPSTPVEETMEAMARLVEEGKVRAIGVSNFRRPLLERAHKALAEFGGGPAKGGLPLASLQPHYSLLHRRIEDDELPWCRVHEVGVVAYSPMERGLLSGRITMDRTFPPGDGRNDDPLFREDNRRRVLEALTKADAIARELDCTLAQLALAWVHGQPGVTAAIAGCRTPEQVEENAHAAEIALDEETSRALARLFDEVEIRR